MAVIQLNKEKVRPEMDFRELNSHVTAHTADADVCADKLREWRRRGKKVALIELRKAYLQIHVHNHCGRIRQLYSVTASLVSDMD